MLAFPSVSPLEFSKHRADASKIMLPPGRSTRHHFNGPWGRRDYCGVPVVPGAGTLPRRT
jgi:hypothetical protein